MSIACLCNYRHMRALEFADDYIGESRDLPVAMSGKHSVSRLGPHLSGDSIISLESR
jgi:hypothetical protein